jgi:4-hydroxy-tetrahydrodipicolinate synthase
VNLSADLVERLAGIDNLVGIKDSSGNIALTAEFINRTPADFAVFQGMDPIIYPSLAIGAVGAIAATGNVAPREAVEIYEAYQAGDHARARKAQEKIALVRQALALGTFPIVIKEAMAMLGVPGGYCRPPAKPLTEVKRRELRATLERIGLLAKAS